MATLPVLAEDTDDEAAIYDIFTKARIDPAVEVHCSRCGRKLTGERSRRLGRGPVCHARIMRAVRTLAESPNASARKAAQLIEDDGIVPIASHGGRVFRCVSSDGQRTYLTSVDGCNCSAGLHESLCYHRVAATVLTAA